MQTRKIFFDLLLLDLQSPENTVIPAQAGIQTKILTLFL